MKPMSTIIKENFCEQAKASLQPVQFQPEDRRIFHLTWGLGTQPLLWPTRQRLTLPPPTPYFLSWGGGHTKDQYSSQVWSGVCAGERAGWEGGKVRDRRAGEERERAVPSVFAGNT